MRPASIFVVTSLALCAPLPVHAETAHAAIAKASLTEVIRPAYAALAAATGSLDEKVAAPCKQPSAGALKEAKDAFAGVVDAWSKVEIFRFGPIVQDHRYERLFYWPDHKSLGLRQVEDALAKADEGVTDPTKLAAKSVALQGLPALEYLLYGEGVDGLAKSGEAATFRCRFTSGVAANVDGIAKAVDEGWRDGAPFATSFLAKSRRSGLSHPERGNARAVQGLCLGHRARARPAARQAVRLDRAQPKLSPSSPRSGGAIFPSPT